MENEFVEKTNKGKVIAIILAIVGVLLIASGSFYYMFFMRLNPDNYLTEMSSKTTSYVTEVFSKFSSGKTNNELKNTKEVGEIGFKSNNDDYAFLENIKFNYTMLTSFKDEKMQFDIDLKDSDKSFLNGSLYLDKNSLNLNVPTLYPKVIKLAQTDESIIGNIKKLMQEVYTIDDLKTIFESSLKYSFEALKEANMKSENVSFTDVKYTYEFNEKNIKKIEDKFTELCKEDSKLQDIVKDNIDMSLSLEELKVEMTVNRFNKEIQEIILESKDQTAKIVKEEKGKYSINNEDKLIITDTKITYEDYDKEVLVGSLELEKLNDGFSFKLNDAEDTIEFSIREVKDGNIRLSLKGEMTAEEKVSFDMDIDVKNEGDVTKTDILTTITAQGETFGISGKTTSSYTDEEVLGIDVSNSIALEDLSEEDTKAISENFVKVLLESSLGDLLLSAEDNSI